MLKLSFGGGRTRRLVHIALTVLIVLSVLVANFAFTAIAADNNLHIDLTNEGRFTLRPRVAEILSAAEMKDDVDIIFCAPSDLLRKNYNTSLVYIMCLELEKQLPNVHVRCVDAVGDPESVAAYKRTSATVIKWDDVIVVSGTEYRVYTTSSFFTVDSESDETVGFNGEQKITEAILSLTAKDLPLACFTNANGESVPRQGDGESGYFFDRVRDAGYEVMTIDLTTEDIPENCALLIINGAKTDFPSDRLDDIDYDSPITKIDRFLDRYGTLMYFRDPTAPALPNLEEFLREWGIVFTVEDNSGKSFAGTTLIDTAAALSGDPHRISGAYGESSIYEDLTKLNSPPKVIFEGASPIRIIWQDDSSSVNSSGRTVHRLFMTSDKAQAVNKEGDTVAQGAYPLMTMTSETRIVDGAYCTANVIVCGTTAFHSAAYLADNVFANGDILQSAMRGVGRTTVSVAEQLEFKYYLSDDFTTTYDKTENTLYRYDEYGKVIWVTDPNTGVGHAAVIRVIRPIEEWEKTLYAVLLILLPT
ncbi:MAG: Gldg family protein, partial [Clostridia bacterium]|nr:Gldg family protein [Clostridia bacterium]